MRGNFTLPAFLIVAVEASGAEVSSKRLIYSFNFSHQISESLVSICRASMALTCFRGNQRNQIPQRKLSDWNCIWFCKDLSLMGRWGCGLPCTRRRPAPFWRSEQILTEGLSRKEGKGRRGLGWSSSDHPPPLSACRHEKQKWDESMLLQAGRGQEWLGEGLWAQSPAMLASAWSPQVHSLSLKEEVQVVAVA